MSGLVKRHNMNLTSVSQVHDILDDLGIRPSKALGQSFLIDKNILGILIKTARLSGDDQVLEVGPGLGVVTEQLLRRVRSVTAVEKDGRLFDFLVRRFRGEPVLKLLHKDALDLDIGDLVKSGVNKVVSNLPYCAGSRILINLVKADAAPPQIVVTVQQEVAERLTARPGRRDYGMLSVWSNLIYSANLVKTVSPSCFWPRPEVRSAIVSMTAHGRHCSLEPEQKRVFYRVTKYAFMHRRKQMTTILSRAPLTLNVRAERGRKLLNELHIEARARPENLTIDNWCALARSLVRRGQGC